MKYQLVDGQVCTDMKQHFVTKKMLVARYWVMNCVIPNTNNFYHARGFIRKKYWLVFIIYWARFWQSTQDNSSNDIKCIIRLWAESGYSSIITQKSHMISWSVFRTKLVKLAVWKIGRNHGWSNGPPMVALWVVRPIFGGPLKIRVNLKLLHRWHMDFKMFSFVDYTLLCWKLILNKKASWKTLGRKNLGRPTDHLGGLLGRPDDL